MTQNSGTGGWVAVPNGTKPTVSISPTPNGGVTDNCAAAGTIAGVCTVVINSSVVNVFSINASLTNFVVNTQSLSRSTNSTAGAAYSSNIAAGGTGTATKTYVAGSIGDFVWWDIDKDGNQDGGEPGIGDVTVFLYGTANGTGPTIATTTTLANGYYVFPGLGTGTYSVRIDPTEFNPAGTLQDWNGSPANVGGAPNDALDSDADPVTHLIQSISINPVSGGLLQNNPTNDFGFYKNSSHTVTKTRITDPTGVGMRIGELITFTVSVQNTGKTWLDVVPISDTYDSLYIEFVRASISGVNTPPDATVSQVGSTFKTKHWHDITGSGSLGPDATIVLHVVFQGVGDTTELGGGAGKPPLQLPCAQVGFTCNQVSTSKPGGTEGPTVDPDGPTGPLPPLETIPPQKDDEPAKVVNPTAIALADYGADVTQTSVTVRWTTVNESEISGFNVYRIDNAGNSLLVGYVEAAKPGQPSGSTYSLTDSNAVYGASYVYILEAQLFSGGKNTETLANTSWLWLANIVR